MPSTIGIKRHNVLDPDLVTLIDAFFAEREGSDVYLTGGTCIAEFHFGHRTSVDMDLFAKDRKSFESARRMIQRGDFISSGRIESRRTTPDLCEFLFVRKSGDPIKIDLMLDLPITLGKKTRCGSVVLDSLPDLLSNKLCCLLHREDVKDYLDLFYLIPASGLTTSGLVDLAKQKDGGCDPLILAHQSLYIQSVNDTPEIFSANVPWANVQSFFAQFHDKLLEPIKPHNIGETVIPE